MIDSHKATTAQALPDKQRKVIMLRYYSELKIVDVARVLMMRHICEGKIRTVIEIVK